MPHIQALSALLAQAERRRDLALAESRQMQAASDGARAQAEQLLDYRREYEARWSAQFCREGHIELVRCYQGFVHRLTQAVQQQAEVAEQAVARLERAQAALVEQELQVAAVKKLLERRHAQGMHSARQQEQKRDDEMAARAAWMRRDAGRPSQP